MKEVEREWTWLYGFKCPVPGCLDGYIKSESPKTPDEAMAKFRSHLGLHADAYSIYLGQLLLEKTTDARSTEQK